LKSVVIVSPYFKFAYNNAAMVSVTVSATENVFLLSAYYFHCQSFHKTPESLSYLVLSSLPNHNSTVAN
jgi:hypothetical protein